MKSISLIPAIAIGMMPMDGMGAKPEGPAPAALKHLNRILDNKVNLDADGDTAISPHVGNTKKKQIRDWLGRMALDLKGGTLEPGPILIDQDLAGVIIHKRHGYDPDQVGAFAVALVRNHDGKWLPAPVPASFENTGAALDFDRRSRTMALERWMLRERSRALDALRDAQVDRMRRDISQAISHDQLKSMSVREVAMTFLDAAQHRDPLRLLGLLGGLSDPLPGDWPARMRSVEIAMTAGDSCPPAWRMIFDPGVARAIVLEESGTRDGLFTLGYIDPFGDVPPQGVPAVGLIHIGLQRNASGAWRINLPVPFFEPEGQPIALDDPDHPFDRDLLDVFPVRLREIHPTSPQPTPEALGARMSECLDADAPGALIELLTWPHDDPGKSRTALGRACRLWWQSRHANGGSTMVPLAIRQDGDQAMMMIQRFSYREPDRTDLRAFHMVRTSEGWLWQSTGKQPPAIPISESLVAWRDMQEAHWRNHWIARMIEPSTKLDRLPKGKPADPAAAMELIRRWLASVDHGKPANALAHTAVLDDVEGPSRLLRNVGYELATKLTRIDGELITRCGEHWTVVCYRRKGDSNPGMALMPVVTTPSGPRVLLEVDLIVGTRQRDFLNNVALDRLNGFCDEEIRDDLRDLVQEFNREHAQEAR